MTDLRPRTLEIISGALAASRGVEADRPCTINGQPAKEWQRDIPTATLIGHSLERDAARSKFVVEARLKCLETAARTLPAGSPPAAVLGHADTLLAYVMTGDDPTDAAEALKTALADLTALRTELTSTTKVAEIGKALARKIAAAPQAIVVSGGVTLDRAPPDGVYKVVLDE